MAATMTQRKNNLIAHCEDPHGNHDKVYMACVKRVASGFEVIGKWGRRGGNLSAQYKGTYNNADLALLKARELFTTKLRKGYEDIADTSRYHGPVTVDDFKRYLEPSLDGEPDEIEPAPAPTVGSSVVPRIKPMPKTSAKAKKRQEEFVVLCLNNTGVEDNFDKGEKHMARRHPSDEGLLQVLNVYGQWQDCVPARFEETTEE